jgi:hypothetical protein
MRSTQSREGEAGLARTAKNMKSVTMSMKSDTVKTDHIVQMLAAKFINRLAPKRVTRTPCRVFMTPCGLRAGRAPLPADSYSFEGPEDERTEMVMVKIRGAN